MKIGVVFPQTEIGHDPAVIRDYAQAVEAMGYTHILVFDHVLGANPTGRAAGRPVHVPRTPSTSRSCSSASCAARHAARRAGDGIVILPQRQTALVAKQAAEVDVLSGGRLRLGVGVGWNAVEFEALGEDFTNRGRRVEEQVEVMRALWTQELVTFDGPRAPRSPTPASTRCPCSGPSPSGWAARARSCSSGWRAWPTAGCRTSAPGAAGQAAIDRIHGLVEGGRPRSQAAFGIEGRMALAQIPPAEWGKEMEAWKAMRGVTHLCVHTGGMGLAKPADHVETLRRFREVVGLK